MNLVTAGIWVRNGRVLVGRRPVGKRLGGFWEFPGGKPAPHETPEHCLARELQEELGVTAIIGQHIAEVEHAYDFGVIRLVAFEVVSATGEPVALDHEELRWVPMEELDSLDLTPADIPLLPAIRRFFRD